MSRKYKNLLPLKINGEYGQGDVFEADLTAEEEADNVASGLIEIQPETYKVVGDSRVHETDPGETFEAALPLGQVELLVAGGHIKPVAEKPEKKPAATTKRTKKEA